MDPELARYRSEQAEGYLNMIRNLYARVRELQAQVDAQRDLVTGLKGIDYTKGIVSGSGNPDMMPDGVAMLFDLIRESVASIDEYAGLQAEAVRTLDEMGGLGAQTLKLRYVFSRTWEQVARSLNYSPSYLKHLAKDAACDYYDYMPPRYRDPRHQAI